MNLFFGAFLLHNHLIQDRSNQGCVDFPLEAQLLFQFLTDGSNVQFLGSGFRLFLPDGCQLGFLLFQLIIQAIVALFEFFLSALRAGFFTFAIISPVYNTSTGILSMPGYYIK